MSSSYLPTEPKILSLVFPRSRSVYKICTWAGNKGKSEQDSVCDLRKAPRILNTPCQISRDRQAQTFTIPPHRHRALTVCPGPLSMELSKFVIFYFWAPQVIMNSAERVQYIFCEASSCTRELKLKPATISHLPLCWTIQFVCARKVNHEFNLNHLFIQFSK